MATHQQVESILKQLVSPNNTINNDKTHHQAIAIVGDWGIGKTYLWKHFYDKEKNNLVYQKYAYVSLFGISSLAELKLKIATEIVSTQTEINTVREAIPWAKRLGGLFSNASLSYSGVSIGISSSIVSSLILADMKETLICLDDLERRGQHLPIDEVMGLVNYLTQEKECSVVCLFNKDEINDEQYGNYKEKVFTHELIIDDSLALVFDKFKKTLNDDFGIDVIERFYSIFGIKNIRFYERVIELYSVFINELLTEKLSDLSKENILSSFLLLKAFDAMPTIMGFDLDKFIDEYSDGNYYVNIFEQENLELRGPIVKAILEKIDEFVGFFKIDIWQRAIIQFMRSFEMNANVSSAIAEDLFSEQTLTDKRALDDITAEYYDLNLKDNFPERLTEALLRNLSNVQYANISFWCSLLEGMGEPEKANLIEAKTKERIDKEIAISDRLNYLDDVYFRGKSSPDDKFYDYIKERLANKSQNLSREEMAQFFINEVSRSRQTISDQFLNSLSKEDLKHIIWTDIRQLQGYTRQIFIYKIIDNYAIPSEKKEQYRQWVVEILREKADISGDNAQQYVISNFLASNNELRNEM